MKLALDHIVHFSNSSPRIGMEKMQELGLHAVMGGRHEKWGTYNSLCYFGLTYLEFLAIEDRSVAETAVENGLIKQIVNELPEGEGLATVALRTNQIDQWAERLRAKGLRVTGPLPGSRTRADGSVITWNTLFAEMEGNSLLFPFFIEWGQNDEQRRNDLTTSGVIAPHPVGGVGIKHVAYAVRQAKETVALLGDLLGGQAGEPFEDTRLNATCQALSFQGGDLLFCSPNGPGLVADALATRGERPFLVQFAGDACRGEAHQVLGSVYRF